MTVHSHDINIHTNFYNRRPHQHCMWPFVPLPRVSDSKCRKDLPTHVYATCSIHARSFSAFVHLSSYQVAECLSADSELGQTMAQA